MMSADLLAEFDSFYQAPTSHNANSGSVSAPKPTSALEDLSFFGSPNSFVSKTEPSQSQLKIPSSKPQGDFWGDFNEPQMGIPQEAAAKPVLDPWGSFVPATTAQGDTSDGSLLQRPQHGGSVDDQYKASADSPKPGIVRVSTDELFSGNIADLAELSAARETKVTLARNIIPRSATSDVLFDASDEFSDEEDDDDDDDDDDFGDFETVNPSTQQGDLLQIGQVDTTIKPGKTRPEPLETKNSLRANSFPYPQAPKSPSFQERNPFADLGLATSSIADIKEVDIPKTESPVTAWPVYEQPLPKPTAYHDSPTSREPNDDDWGDFADFPGHDPSLNVSKGIQEDAWAWDSVDNQLASAPKSTVEVLAPTNVPPPSVLLAIFPQLFNLPQSSLYQVVANQPFSLKNRILSDPSTIDFLRGYILVAAVAARIISGRKLRWKRDTHLSQAMKIGPAAANGKGGMKLSGIDKAESTKEEREATDLVRIWKEQVGRLRSAVAAANSSITSSSSHLVIPEISENMVVKSEGGMTAPKACFLCGLKREERIAKVDNKVEDSFGEWWVEHWGHRTCRNFWQEHEILLRTR